jgi:NAD(P)-dependent dehydrogenase (short-subunit alcohol dehydrogenase family)
MEIVMKSLVWFITGASRGFGLEIARAALERGDAVLAAARDSKVVERALGRHEQLVAVELDAERLGFARVLYGATETN